MIYLMAIADFCSRNVQSLQSAFGLDKKYQCFAVTVATSVTGTSGNNVKRRVPL